MYLLWEPVVRPLLDLLHPRVIVEVGSDLGYGTRNLLHYCRRHGAVLHAVDPLPKFDVEEWVNTFPDTLIFHQTTSLQALPTIERPDAVLIDGDHNWHTVFHELKALDETVRKNGTPFPLVLLHDVGWPYGRRDLYYDPERIPEPHRHPHMKGGLRPGREDLDPDGGLNTHLFNALTGGGPRNGVLTGVEDFIEQSSTRFKLVVVPGLHGLGILLPAALGAENRDLGGFIEGLEEADALRALLAAVEESRLESLIDSLDEKRRAADLAQVRRSFADHEAKLKRQHKEFKVRLGSLQQERDQTRALLNRVRGELNARTRELKARTQEVESRTQALQTRNQELRDAKKEVRARTRAHDARARELAVGRQQVRVLVEQVEELKKQRQSVEAELQRLASRRSVRLVLKLADAAKPVFRLRRSLAKSPSRRQQASPHTSVQSDNQPDQQFTEASGDEAEPRGGEAYDSSHVTKETPAQGTSGTAGKRVEEKSSDDAADIVVCIYNAREDVERCLQSIIAYSDLSHHNLILVDDGSDVPVQQMLEDFVSRHRARLIRNDHARGYTKAANQGIAASTSPYVVLLNSDTIVGPGWLDKLIRCALTMPDAAIVGPLSNAASWQSIPDLTNREGAWHLNPLPEGVSVEERGRCVERWSPRLYPEVPLVNGFCYLISRAALQEVGPLDEENFPRGYGEEDDFSIRSAEAGFKLYIADDCYIHHAKSRSFTSEGRLEIVRGSKESLSRKHGADQLKERVEEIRLAEDLIRSRTFVGEAVKREHQEFMPPELEGYTPRVAWIQPHFEEVGGIRRAIEMTNRLNGWGFRTVLITPEGRRAEWLPVLSEVISMQKARSMTFDILIGSDPDVIWAFLEIEAKRKVNYHLAAYMLYRQLDESLRAYYDSADSRIVHVANSKWTAEQVQSFADISIQGIFPGGVDKDLFRPMRVERTHDVVSSGSTRKHKGGEIIDLAMSTDLSLLSLRTQRASQARLPSLINSGRVYASACWHEGFNLSVLEAMACGVPVVMTNDGGSTEYAVDSENALVVESRDPEALRAQILRALDDKELRARLIENGLRTAWSYDWDLVTAEFGRYLVSVLLSQE